MFKYIYYRICKDWERKKELLIFFFSFSRLHS